MFLLPFLKLIAAVTLFGGALYGAARLIGVLAATPRRLAPHLLAALVWTAVCACQTMLTVESRPALNLPGATVAIVAGWVMVSSWRQFAARLRHGDGAVRRPLVARLFTQMLWGPLALCVIVGGVSSGVNHLLVRHALARRDLPALRGFQAQGIVADHADLQCGLRAVIAKQDVRGVETYLAAGANAQEGCNWHPDGCPIAAATRLPSTAITELLLKVGSDGDYDDYYPAVAMRSAVRAHRVEQVRTLLSRGTDVGDADFKGDTALDMAKRQHDAAIVALFESAEAKEKALLNVMAQVRTSVGK